MVGKNRYRRSDGYRQDQEGGEGGLAAPFRRAGIGFGCGLSFPSSWGRFHRPAFWVSNPEFLNPMVGRWIGILLLAVLAGLACFLLYVNGPEGVPWLPECFFRKFTGLNCPGCGMTRATYAILHGDFGKAFRLNPLGMLLLPIALLGLSLEVVGWVRGRPLPWKLDVGQKGVWVLFWILLAYWVLRNLPWWPFTLLAPP